MQKKYMLAIKRDHNDYLPLEWNYLSCYEKEDLTTLEGIDSFTQKQSSLKLIDTIITERFVSSTEKFNGFVILHIEQEHKRELEVVFKEDKEIINFDELIAFLVENATDKDLMNQVYMLCQLKNPSIPLQKFNYILKNISLFKEKGRNGLSAALLQFHTIPYEEKRKIAFSIYKKIITPPVEKQENKLIKKEVA